MKSPKSKEDLIETVMKQIELDVHCHDFEAIEELVKFCPTENLIAYLPEEDWKKFKHLQEDSIDILMNKLITKFPNDQELGKEIRKLCQK